MTDIEEKEITSTEETISESKETRKVTKGTKRSFWASLGTVAVVIAAILLFILRGTSAGPTAASTGGDFLGHISAGEYEQAMDLATPEFKKLVSVETLEGFAKQHAVLSQNNFEEFDKEMVEASQTILVGELTDDAGTEAPVIIYVVPDENAEWKISFFSINPSDLPIQLHFGNDVDQAEDGNEVDTEGEAEVGEEGGEGAEE